MARKKESAPASTGRKVLKPSDVAKLFLVSNRTVYRWIEERVFPQYGIEPWFTPSGEPRFYEDEVKRAIMLSRQGGGSLRDELLHICSAIRARVVVCANQKGGVGKTTTAVNTGAALADEEHGPGDRVLIIDMDPQGNATQHLGYGTRPGFRQYKHCVADIWGLDPEKPKVSLKDVVVPTEHENIFLAPMDDEGLYVEHAVTATMLKIANGQIRADGNQLNNALREFYGTFARELKELLAVQSYDWVIIDTPPTLGPLTTSALAACDSYITPVEPEVFSSFGTELFEALVNELMNMMGREIECLGYLINYKQRRSNVREDVLATIKEQVGDQLFETVLPEDTNIVSAQAHGKTLFYNGPAVELDPETGKEVIKHINYRQSRACEAFVALAQEIRERMERLEAQRDQKSAAGKSAANE